MLSRPKKSSLLMRPMKLDKPQQMSSTKSWLINIYGKLFVQKSCFALLLFSSQSCHSVADVIYPYQLKQVDLLIISEQLKEFGLSASMKLDIVEATVWKPGSELEEKHVAIEFGVEKLTSRIERYHDVQCHEGVDKQRWACRSDLSWRMETDNKEKRKVSAYNFTMGDYASFIKVLDMAVNNIGLSTSLGTISSIKRVGERFEISFGTTNSKWGCKQIYVAQRKVIEWQLVWTIDYNLERRYCT